MNADEKRIYTIISNLMPKTTDSFQILDLTTDTVKIAEDEIHNTVSLHKATLTTLRSNDFDRAGDTTSRRSGTEYKSQLVKSKNKDRSLPQAVEKGLYHRDFETETKVP